MRHSNSLYLDLYEKLKKQIIEGQYQSNDRFPSKRQLSEHLSLSNTTIEHAYQLLLDEGFIYSKPRSGYYVSDIESLPVLPNPYVIISNEQIDGIDLNVEHNDYDYSFNLSEIDAEHFPSHLFRKYAKEVFEDHNLDFLQRGNKQGEFELRQQIAHYLFTSRGVTAHPQQIVIGSSTEQLLNMLTDILESSSFIIEKPSYPPIKQVLDKKKFKYLQVPVEKSGIQTKPIFSSNYNVLYITPSHQFPTGHVMNLKKRTQLINWAQHQTNRYIIEDDYDSEFRYFGKPIPALQSLDSQDKIIYISTFSKSIYPSCRIAYIVLPPKILDLYHQYDYSEANTAPVHIQRIIAQFMSSGSFERHLNKMRKIYKEKLTYILNALSPYEEQLKVDGALTGMHFTLTVLNGLSMEECIDRAKHHSLKLTPYQFDDDVKIKPKFIIGFGGIPKEQLNSHTEALINSLIIK
ncbi:PLP-dependent aminotransferase family protein [Staphylococcus pasteuri]|uniref:MocR-like pyridoxine biosynthesis transcription factor PdxR n=1 Tax=Staphylococcus pasteuri TaxID=45972 RepID=UPI001E638B11|nr:PLP-dependent aminotransferase family protein [Staphylococcus pasteuri]MCD9066287.1 PLP-dependent aminotransferase family protein [Staphylococcus pasteuri]WAE41586.1 PLP-dependent aminotransferase family protein [Staphylococcus pasteuri]